MGKKKSTAGVSIVREPGDSVVRKSTWFNCECGNRIVTNHWPVKCVSSECGILWSAKGEKATLGWHFISMTNAVVIAFAKHFPDAPPGLDYKVARMASVSSRERQDTLKRLVSKYGREGQRIPWDYVNQSGHIENVPRDWCPGGSETTRVAEATTKTPKSPGSNGDADGLAARVLEMRADGQSYKKIAEELGITDSKAWHLAKRAEQ